MTQLSATLITLLNQRATLQPNQCAYTFLIDGESEVAALTYADLDRRARAIATELMHRNLTGERALLLFQPGLDYIAAFFGCLYAGVIAVPAYPPKLTHLERALPRLLAMATDAQPSIALTTSQFLQLDTALHAQSAVFQHMQWLAIDQVNIDGAAAWRSPEILPNTRAFLQYTSGSTALPKGVILTHDNLLHNSALIYHAFGHSSSSKGMIWLPPYHDMGLIGGIIQPLYGNFPVTLMSPVNFLQRPLRWLEAITRNGATTSGGPNFAYDLCVRKTTPEQRAKLDLSTWKVAFTGAEPIRPDTLERFTAAFAPAGFCPQAWYPCYGLAEATLIISGGHIEAFPTSRRFYGAALKQHKVCPESATAPGGHALVSCGRVLEDQQVVIVDPSTYQLCESHQVGEIWVSGRSVAQGYWNRPTETAETFQAYIADSLEGPFLRTGDLGFVDECDLFITGRLKDLIIIRGRNLYPHDLELTVERSHESLRPASGAAVAVQIDGEERLVIVQEIERRARNQNLTPVMNVIRQALVAEHEVQPYAIVLIKPGTIPKTSSGKIQRHRCREDFLIGALDVVASSSIELDVVGVDEELPWLSRDALLISDGAKRQSLLEEGLQTLAARLLRVPAAQLDLQQPMTALGLDSLMAIEWQHRIEAELGVHIPMVRFLEGTTIAQLARELLGQLARPAAPLKPLRAFNQMENLSYPLSAGQQALQFIHQLAPGSAAYNMAVAVRIRSALDIPALRRAFQALVDRHPLLRTTFSTPEGGPIQSVHPGRTVWFQQVDSASDWSEATLADWLATESQQSFDLEHDALLKIYLLTRFTQEHVLLLVVHHLVADFWSLAVLVQELSILYPAEQSGNPILLPPLDTQYSDYVFRQKERLSGPIGEKLWAFWKQQMAGELPILALPTDRPRPPRQTYAGATHAFKLRADLTQGLKSFSYAQEATLYMTLLAAFQVLLSRYTGQTDILVGSPTTGRQDADMAAVVGYFVNPIVIRGNLAKSPPFSSFLRQIRETVLAAFAHQEYPFPLLTQRLCPERDLSRSPIFQAMFILQKTYLTDDTNLSAFALGASGVQINIGGLTVESQALEQQIAQFDLTLTMAEVGDQLVGGLQYNKDLFDAPTIIRMAQHWQTLLESILAFPEVPVVDLPLLPDAERHRLLAIWNDPSASYKDSRTLHAWFEAQAARTPDAAAVICQGRAPDATAVEQISYRILNERASHVAGYLRRLGVGPEVRVGVYMERSIDLIVALLGILKAGAAYVPLDPSYPQERLALVVQNAQMPVIVTQESLAGLWLDVLATVAPQGASSDSVCEGSRRSSATADHCQVIYLDRDWSVIAAASSQAMADDVQADNLAYIIYTSGSTGIPKGVAITHSNAGSLITWAQSIFTRSELAAVLAATSLCFDLSIFEIFVPLSVGGTVILIDNILQLPQLPSTLDITLVNTVPSAMIELLRLGLLPSSVTTVNLAGEPLPRHLVQQLYQQTTVRHVYNLYGPSEDTTYSTFALIRHDDSAHPSIGRPITNTQAYILDHQMQPVPIGITGELYLGGAGLARGYLNHPTLTASRFVPNPFNTYPGMRLYRTGDLARYLADGTIEFLGRVDQQVKVRGFRIELKEIEGVLAQHRDVQESAVLVREDQMGEHRLVAYIVPRQASQPTITELRSLLQRKLPHYMLPSAFVILDMLPLTPNGKLDRRALPAPGHDRPDLASELELPRTQIEVTLAGMWIQLLSIEEIGIHDNFFDLGGHSLLAIQLIARMRIELQVEMPVHQLFETPTISGLASWIETLRWATQDSLMLTNSAFTELEEGYL
jgi:amino acid adenylation domain-containing protein